MSPARELGCPFTSSVFAPDAVLYVPQVDTHTVAVVASWYQGDASQPAE
jgi:hypothetical protein